MSNSIGFGNEFKILGTDGTLRWAFRFNEDATLELLRYNSDGELQETVASVTAAGIVTFTNANLALSDDSVDSAQIADGAVDPVHLAATVITGTADAAIAILNTTTHISLNSTTGAKAITTTSAVSGQIVSIVADTVSGGSYTLAVTGGTLTLNSAGEMAVVKRVGSAWQALALTPSTSTAANIATIV